MNRVLHFVMVGLVATTLGFAYMTDAASWSWLGPLLVLTLASPFLSRYREFFAYRPLWNCTVIVVFILLIHNTLTRGVQHLLEDGLRLSALCQVHLLNNLTDRQKPDLLFFNSFLIAVVTSFLSLDLGYSMLFVLYAVLLVVGMQLTALQRSGFDLRALPLRRVVGQGVVRAGAVFGLTLCVFFFMPRDFGRRGLLGGRLQPPDALMQVDFTEEVSLDRSGVVSASDRVVMTIVLKRGRRQDVPAHWRGATLDVFDGIDWRGSSPRVRDHGLWKQANRRTVRRAEQGRTSTVFVELAAPSTTRLFAPLDAQRVKLDARPGGMIMPQPDRTLKYRRRSRTREPTRYWVELFRIPQRSKGSVGARHWRYYSLAPNTTPARALEIAKEIRAASGPDEKAIVEGVRRYLATSFHYLAPGDKDGARNLDEFFGVRAAGGHCEVFATAMTVMLRCVGIPCRLVTGYRSGEWDDEGKTLTLRALHAHAWVEVLDENANWYTVDPTPPADSIAGVNGGGWMQAIRTFASTLWARVV
ncbi:MAG: DUF3488 and transglutaminase-like domain-containing protein, partial [Planctomycetota bacterium]|nr:DUF3488 and transglutaminase-like domain-containing protein [Planctomycetota bacterium]